MTFGLSPNRSCQLLSGQRPLTLTRWSVDPCLVPSVPCAPANPHTIHDCSSNVIVFSWQPTNNTFYYVATAEDDTGKVTECRTPDNTCFFTNTGCGQFYTYSVYAVSSGCNSQVSQPQFVRTRKYWLVWFHTHTLICTDQHHVDRRDPDVTPT